MPALRSQEEALAAEVRGLAAGGSVEPLSGDLFVAAHLAARRSLADAEIAAAGAREALAGARAELSSLARQRPQPSA